MRVNMCWFARNQHRGWWRIASKLSVPITVTSSAVMLSAALIQRGEAAFVVTTGMSVAIGLHVSGKVSP